MESDWVYCHFRQKKDSLNNFTINDASVQKLSPEKIFFLSEVKKWLYRDQ